MDTKPTYDLEALIVTAFRTARDRGKPDWRRMTIAVLKNRLLQMTRGSFSESAHGVRSLRELLERYPGLVQVDGRGVELIESGAPAAIADDQEERLRPDLWRAMVDYRSGVRYAWDPAIERARDATDHDALILPTVSGEDMAQWRTEFAKRAPDNEQVIEWCAKGLGTHALPPGFRSDWNRFVHDQVSDRLSRWARENNVTFSSERPTRQASSTDRLRELVHLCVDVMSRDELAALPIPVGVVLRANTRGRLP